MLPSRERRRHAARMVTHELATRAEEVSYEAKVVYVVGCLVCNDVGYLRKDDLASGMGDPEIVSMAQNILTKCGYPPAEGRLS